jgi:hypothetical protein
MDQDDPAAYRLITGESQDTVSNLPGDATTNSQNTNYMDAGNNSCNPSCKNGCNSSCYCPRWTASADFIILDRIGGTNQTLVRGFPIDSDVATDPDMLNGNGFHPGFYGGPRVGLIRHGDRCYDLEMLYFQIDGWNNSKRVNPDGDVLVFTAPGDLNFRTTDPIQFNYGSKLYNAEFNVRWNPTCRVTMLAGFRWAELRENLEGGVIAPLLEPFWQTRTNNNLYGFQIGTDAKVLDRGCFSIDGLVKAGVFCNHAEQTSTIIDTQITSSGSSSTNHTAFLGEIGLQCKYQVTCNLTLRAGYEALWIQGVALAPGQIQESNFATEQFGINTNSGVFYHGATAGFEYNF